MMMTVGGCAAPVSTPASETAKSVMQSINSKNILESDGEGRLWYVIKPSIFAGGHNGVQGSIRTLLQDLTYLSDGDPNTDGDLNMTGLLFDDFVLLDEAGAPVDLATMNPTLGNDEDMQALCAAASSINVPVMITLPLTSISKENDFFKRLIEVVSNAGDQDPAEIDPDLIDMFYVEKDHPDQTGWIRIGETDWYYGSLSGSDTPRLNLSSINVRNLIMATVDRYLGLGIGGFFVPEYKDLNHGDSGQNAEFATWFDQMVKDRKPGAVNVFASVDWVDEMGSVPAYFADINASGAQGMIAKAATGAISARDLGAYLSDYAAKTENVQALFLNDDAGSLDLLKSESRLAQYKLALALELMNSGQVFVQSGDELGLLSAQSEEIVSAMETEDSQQEGEQTETPRSSETGGLQFGTLAQQKEDGNSIFSFVQQAILLRDSYRAVSSGSTSWNQDLSTDQVLVLDKKKDSSETVLVFNFSDTPQDVDTASLSINGLPAELGGCLLTGTDPVSQEGTVIHLPAYSMALLK